MGVDRKSWEQAFLRVLAGAATRERERKIDCRLDRASG